MIFCLRLAAAGQTLEKEMFFYWLCLRLLQHDLMPVVPAETRGTVGDRFEPGGGE